MKVNGFDTCNLFQLDPILIHLLHFIKIKCLYLSNCPETKQNNRLDKIRNPTTMLLIDDISFLCKPMY